jgi:hypothetical protein
VGDNTRRRARNIVGDVVRSARKRESRPGFLH